MEKLVFCCDGDVIDFVAVDAVAAVLATAEFTEELVQEVFFLF